MREIESVVELLIVDGTPRIKYIPAFKRSLNLFAKKKISQIGPRGGQ